MVRRVLFNSIIQTFPTYSYKDYDRTSIDHVLYRRAHRRISDEEMNKIFICLDLYKLYEMPIHNQSIHNIQFHLKKFRFGNELIIL